MQIRQISVDDITVRYLSRYGGYVQTLFGPKYDNVAIITTNKISLIKDLKQMMIEHPEDVRCFVSKVDAKGNFKEYVFKCPDSMIDITEGSDLKKE